MVLSNAKTEIDHSFTRRDLKGLSYENAFGGSTSFLRRRYTKDLTDVDIAIILRKNPYKLVEVYEKRKYAEEKIKENLGSEILGIIAHDAISEFGIEKTFQVDTTEKTPAAIVEKIQNVIQERKNSDDVDWLSEIKQNNDLDVFFDY